MLNASSSIIEATVAKMNINTFVNILHDGLIKRNKFTLQPWPNWNKCNSRGLRETYSKKYATLARSVSYSFYIYVVVTIDCKPLTSHLRVMKIHLRRLGAIPRSLRLNISVHMSPTAAVPFWIPHNITCRLYIAHLVFLFVYSF